MLKPEWTTEFPGSVIVCDPDGIILDMNQIAARSYQEQGGMALIGTCMVDCHPEQARLKVEELLADHKANIYTVEKNGIKKLVYQSPWYENGEYSGFVEFVLEIPYEMPHFLRG